MSEPKQKPGGSSGPGLFHIWGPDPHIHIVDMNSIPTPPAVSAPPPGASCPELLEAAPAWPAGSHSVRPCEQDCVCLFPQFPEYDDLYCKFCFVYGQDWAPTAVSWALRPPRLTAFVTGRVSEGSITPFPLPVQNQLRVQGWHTL